MLLIGCTAGAFTACSDGDDDQKPSCPITEYTVPPTAEIGGFYTVTGKGFEASAQLFLRDASGSETAAADQTVTAAGIECTVPATLTAGVYTVVVKQNGSWELGPVRLETAQNPVSSVVLPAAIKLNKTLEIAGNGFTSASRIFLETADAAKTRTELTAAPSPTGLSCTIPDGVAAGTYNVILKHNNIDWTLGENIPAAVYKRLKEFKITQSETYDTDRMDKALFREKVKEMLETDAGEGNVDDETLDMMVEMFMSSFVNSEGLRTDELYIYNAEDRLTAVQKPNEEGAMADWFVFSYDGDKISATNEQYDDYSDVKAFTWTLADGNVESAIVDFGKRATDFKWNYDTDGYCIGMSYATNDRVYTTFGYTAGNFSKFATQTSEAPTDDLFVYGDAGLKNNVFGVDVSKALLHSNIIFDSLTEDCLFANVSGVAGKASVNLPSGMVESEEKTLPFTYTYDTDGYAISVKWGSSGVDPMFSVCPYESATIVEFIYE